MSSLGKNISSIPEVAGEEGLWVDKMKADNFIYEIIKLEDNGYRNDLIQKGLEQSKI